MNSGGFNFYVRGRDGERAEVATLRAMRRMPSLGGIGRIRVVAETDGEPVAVCNDEGLWFAIDEETR